MLTPAHIRIAMVLLDLSQQDVGDAIGVSGQTVGKYAGGRGAISSDTLGDIEKYFKSKGVVFLDDDQPSLGGGIGVRLKA